MKGGITIFFATCSNRQSAGVGFLLCQLWSGGFGFAEGFEDVGCVFLEGRFLFWERLVRGLRLSRWLDLWF